MFRFSAKCNKKKNTKNLLLNFHTPAAGDGQQCKAAPACTASIDPDANGSLATSALTKAMFLRNKYN